MMNIRLMMRNLVIKLHQIDNEKYFEKIRNILKKAIDKAIAL